MTPFAYAKLLGAALVVAFLFLGGRSCGKQAGDAEVKALKLQYAQETAHVAGLAIRAAEAVRAEEHQQAQRFVDIAVQNQRKLKDAQANADAVVADLRAGNRRLRQQWQGCVSTSGLAAQAAAGASGADDAADVLPAGVGRVLGIVGACQAHVESLQAVLTAERTP